MIGGGFLGQMHETMKKNREMIRESLGKKKRKAFDKGEYASSDNKVPLEMGPNLTDAERQELITKVRVEQRRQSIQRVIILMIAAVILAVAWLGLDYFFK